MFKKISFIICLLFTGCGFSVSFVKSNPNINIHETEKSINIELDSDIENSYRNETVTVKDWQKSLYYGFKQSFSDSYHMSESNPDITLMLKRADLRIDPVGFYESRSSYAEPTGYQASIEFSASLKNKQGKIIRRTSGIAKSKRLFIDNSDANDSAKTAIEDMYEKIAYDLF